DEGPDKGGPFGPYVQSERLQKYRETAELLVQNGRAYRCFCTPERLTELRTWQESQKMPLGYDRHCRSLSVSESEQFVQDGLPYVVRFLQPTEGSIEVRDEILGPVLKACSDLPVDPVLLKSDGFPTYHLAHVVDDHAMQTTHVLRAQEWLPSAPLHVQLFNALGWEVPRYVHLPLILGADGQKLSKRHGATSVRQFRDSGYLPEALVNYLALLGWSGGGDREFYSLPELEALFSLERLNKSPAIFDYKKLDHFNASFIRKKSDSELAALVALELERSGLLHPPLAESDQAKVAIMTPLIKERMTFLPDAVQALRFVFSDVHVENIEDLVPKKGTREGSLRVLEAALGLIADLESQPTEVIEELFRSKAEALGVKLGDFMHPVRVALTGSKVSPPMFGSMRALGVASVRKRLEAALAALQG
ncbi:MAG: glutamate--tRNA ligase, partial [Spirochaetales bacterium]|nr:glutamate--tRNA ligase [Spirochaetales bacterium]